METYTCDEPDPKNGAILYTDIEFGTLRVSPQTYQDGWNRKWTGNAEIEFRANGSEEFDVIETLPGISPENAIEFAEDALRATVKDSDLIGYLERKKEAEQSA